MVALIEQWIDEDVPQGECAARLIAMLKTGE